MKLFVTGASGGLGKPLTAVLLAQGHSLTLLSRRALPAATTTVVRGDLLNLDSYSKILPGHDAVLHLAAVTHSQNPDDYYAANALGTEVLTEAAGRASVRRFVFVSTRAVGRACGAYGESKAMAEEAVRQSGLDWTILRPGEVYGSPGVEALDRMIKAVRQGFLLPYVADPRALLTPVHHEDVLLAMAATLASPVSIGKVYTLAGPETLTQRAMIRLLRTVYPGPRLPVPVPVPLLRAAALAFRLLGIKNPPFVADQVPRLLCAKLQDIAPAWNDFGFAPRTMRQGIATHPSQI